MADAGSATSGGPGGPPPEPSHAERVRTILQAGRNGALATVSARHGGAPFASLMPYGVLDDGSPTILVSRLAAHARNLDADPRASLLVVEAAEPGDEVARGRATLVGRVEPVEPGRLDAVRAGYLERHPAARAWASFGDFSFRRLRVDEAHLVAGFGAVGWVSGADLRTAAPDPLADAAAGILDHMNADHADALALLARTLGGVEAARATMTGVDRLGMRVRVAPADGTPQREIRIAFPAPVATPDETRRALVAMVRAARGAAGR